MASRSTGQARGQARGQAQDQLAGQPRSQSKQAVDAQRRRDNEAEARETLNQLLPAEAYPAHFSEFRFNGSTKTLAAALLYLDPTANTHGVPSTYTDPVQYNQFRRDNETAIRDRLDAKLPQGLSTSSTIDRRDFNKTTKVLVAAAFHIQDLLRKQRDQGSDSPTPTDLDNMSKSSRTSTVGSDKGSESQEDQPLVAQQIVASTNKTKTNLAVAEACLDKSSEGDEVLAACVRPRQPEELRSGRKRKLDLDLDMDDDMPRKTRSFTGPQTLAPKAAIPPTNPVTSTANEHIAPKGKFDGVDLLANLRAEQAGRPFIHPPMPRLDLKPPPYVRKHPNGLWEVRLRDPRNARHPDEYIRIIESVADRMVASAKELVQYHNGDQKAYASVIIKAQETCCDIIKMFDGNMSTRRAP